MTFYFEQLVWIGLAIVGILFSLHSINEAQLDIRALRMLGKNGQRKLVAKFSLAIETRRTMVQAMFLAAGVASIFGPYPANPHNPAGYMLIIASALLAYNSFAAFRVRKQLLSMSDYSLEEDHQRHVVRDAGRDQGRDPIRDAARDIARDLIADAAELRPGVITPEVKSALTLALEQLHKDNVEAASTLVEADESTVRKVKPVDKR